MGSVPIARLVDYKYYNKEQSNCKIKKADIETTGIRVLDTTRFIVFNLPLNEVDLAKSSFSKAEILRLPMIEGDYITNEYKLTVISVIKKIGYKVSDYVGNIFIVSEKELVNQASYYSLTNAKIVTGRLGKASIIPIKGKFLEESITIPKIASDNSAKLKIIAGIKPEIKFICRSLVVLDCGEFDLVVDKFDNKIKCKASFVRLASTACNFCTGIMGEIENENGSTTIVAISDVVIKDKTGFKNIDTGQVCGVIEKNCMH